MLARRISNLMWHNLYVTPPLFRHSNFNVCFQSFEGTFMFFCSVLLMWCQPDLLFARTLLFVFSMISHKSHIISLDFTSISIINTKYPPMICLKVGIPFDTYHLVLLCLYINIQFMWYLFVSTRLHVFSQKHTNSYLPLDTWQKHKSTIWLLPVCTCHYTCWGAKHTNWSIWTDIIQKNVSWGPYWQHSPSVRSAMFGLPLSISLMAMVTFLI